MALGGWVSTNYAVLACRDFPTCQGSWWPTMDFAQGFELWRDLGKTGAGDHIAFAALTAIHYAHRLAAYLVLLVVLGMLLDIFSAIVIGRGGVVTSGTFTFPCSRATL